MTLVRFMLILAAMFAQAGCTLLQDAGTTSRPEEVGSMAESGTEVERLLAYFHRVRKLTGADLAREQDSAKLAYARRQSDFQRVRLAMALSQPSAGGGDQARAIELLDPVARNPNANLNGLAFLISSYVQEQRRLENSMQNMQQRVDSVKVLEKNLAERDQAIQAMQQKLDALKSMEKTLLEREQAGAKRR